VFESRPQKTKLKTARRGEFFAARPAGSVFGNSGMSGSPFLGLLSFGETKESDLLPGNPRPTVGSPVKV
jgi:hypothetical protein